jgi:alkylated DNA repair dioxygenase AlkB
VPANKATLDLFGDDALPQGMKYRPDFVAAEEERDLLRQIEALPFKEFEFHGFTGKRRTVSYGWRYDFNGGGLEKTEDMPAFLLGLRGRAEDFSGVAAGDFQQVLVTEYEPAAGIGWHLPFAKKNRKRLPTSKPYRRAPLDLPFARSLTQRVGAQHSRR